MFWKINREKTGTHWIYFENEFGHLYFTWEGLNDWQIDWTRFPVDNLLEETVKLTECAIAYFDYAGGFGIGGLSEELVPKRILEVEKWL